MEELVAKCACASWILFPFHVEEIDARLDLIAIRVASRGQIAQLLNWQQNTRWASVWFLKLVHTCVCVCSSGFQWVWTENAKPKLSVFQYRIVEVLAGQLVMCHACCVSMHPSMQNEAKVRLNEFLEKCSAVREKTIF